MCLGQALPGRPSECGIRDGNPGPDRRGALRHSSGYGLPLLVSFLGSAEVKETQMYYAC